MKFWQNFSVFPCKNADPSELITWPRLTQFNVRSKITLILTNTLHLHQHMRNHYLYFVSVEINLYYMYKIKCWQRLKLMTTELDLKFYKDSRIIKSVALSRSSNAPMLAAVEKYETMKSWIYIYIYIVHLGTWRTGCHGSLITTYIYIHIYICVYIICIYIYIYVCIYI